MPETPNLNIALVDEDDQRCTSILAALNRGGHHALGLSSVDALNDEIGTMPIDLLLLSLDPGMDEALALIQRFREAQPFAGIVAYAGVGQSACRLSAYLQGADVCVEDPVIVEELVAAVGAVARRLHCFSLPDPLHQGDELSLNQSSMQLRCGSGSVCLSAAEAAILAALARAPGHRLDTWQINELLGVELGEHSKANLEVRIVRLRNKFARIGAHQPCLRAVRLQGYQLCVALQIV